MMELNNPEQREEAALYYASKQLSIIPVCPSNHSGMTNSHREKCGCPGKTPIIKDWTNHMSTSEEEVQGWFQGLYPNLGLVLGQTETWNLVGIDVDGDIGEELLADWSQGNLPDTWEFATGNGRRLLYQLPTDLISKKFKKAEGEHQELALLATGQQTVIPPSVHISGRVYTWAENHSPEQLPIAKAPTWIINRVAAVPLVNATEEIVMNLEGFDDAPLSKPVLPEEWSRDVGAGERSNHLARIMGSRLARHENTKEEYMQIALDWNRDHCKPPLPVAEVTAMIESLYAAEAMKVARRPVGKGKNKHDDFVPMVVAEAFLKKQDEQGKRWIFDDIQGRFFACDDTCGPWKVQGQTGLDHLVRLFLHAIDPTWGQSHHIREVINAFKGLVKNTEDVFNIGRKPRVDTVFVENGMLDWNTEVLSPWNPGCLSPIQLPVRWDPEARKHEAYAHWLATLKEWLPDEESRLFLQEYIGYCLTPDYGFRIAVFLYGGGSNGKSLFIDVVRPLFGEYVNFTNLQRLSGKFDTINLLNKLLNVCSDIDSTYLPETGTIKSIIAGDPITGEYKFGNSFHFTAVCRLLFSANTLPKASDKSEGWFGRWRFIEFARQFAVNPIYARNLKERMQTPEALSALLCWAVAGLQRLYAQRKFTDGEGMRASAQAYREDNDNTMAFCTACIHTCPHVGGKTQLSTTSLYKVYKRWVEDNGSKAVGQIEFIKRLQAIGFHKEVRPIGGKSVNVIIGIQFSEDNGEIDLVQTYNFNESLRVQGIN